MKTILAGAGAFGQKHLDAIRKIGGIEVVAVVGRDRASTLGVAEKYGIAHATTSLTEALALPGVESAILCTPTQLHASQALECLNAGKHVQVEIPLADRWEDALAVAEAQKRTGLVCMVGHTRRFNPSHQWVHRRIAARELSIQQMDVQTYFFRRTNTNALGQPRSWTDHLLWHHAAHTVDLFQYQTGEEVTIARAIEGPHHPVLGIAMDMSIQLKAAGGAICTLSIMTVLWVRSFAISATTVLTLPATTTCSTARRSPSTCPAWTSRRTASSCRTANSSAQSVTDASRTPALPTYFPATGRCTSWSNH